MEHVAVLVIDIVGSTELARELGDVRFFDLVARYHGVVRAEGRRVGALNIKLQGDGAFVVFASVDAALTAAQAVQRRLADWPLATRTAVHAGPAIAAEGDYYGLTPNMAAHIADLADGGQVLVSDATVAAARDGFAFGPPRQERVRGVGDAVRLRDLMWQ